MLVRSAHARIETGVVRQRLDAGFGQPAGGILDLLAAERVDDAGLSTVRIQELHQLGARVVLERDAVTDVRPIEARHELARPVQSQPLDDLLACARVGGGGKRDARHLRKAFLQDRQLAILRTEIVSPLRNAVRLVDGEQRSFDSLEQPKKALREEAFGRNVKQLELAGDQAALDLPLVLAGQARVEVCRGHAGFAQVVDLVLHQGNQRRHHDGGAWSKQRGNLIAQRLAAAGGHQHQRIAALGHRLHDGLLRIAEAGVTEDAVEKFECAGGHRTNASKGPSQAYRRQAQNDVGVRQPLS